jgi:hypothetical protein
MSTPILDNATARIPGPSGKVRLARRARRRAGLSARFSIADRIDGVTTGLSVCLISKPRRVASADDEQVELRAGVEVPAVRLVRLRSRGVGQSSPIAKPSNDAPTFGCPSRSTSIDDPEQRVEQARVGQVDLGRLDLALREVLLPGSQAPDHERGDKHVEVVAHGLVRDAERASQLTAVPGLPMVVGDHRPEATHGVCADVQPEMRQVTFEVGARELLSPAKARAVVSGEERSRKATSQPECARNASSRPRRA